MICLIKKNFCDLPTYFLPMEKYKKQTVHLDPQNASHCRCNLPCQSHLQPLPPYPLKCLLQIHLLSWKLNFFLTLSQNSVLDHVATFTWLLFWPPPLSCGKSHRFKGPSLHLLGATLRKSTLVFQTFELDPSLADSSLIFWINSLLSLNDCVSLGPLNGVNSSTLSIYSRPMP